MNRPYYSVNDFLKEKYGEKVYKIALDAGMTCPNRDGTLGTRGCIFCSVGGSGDFAVPRTSSITEQLQAGLSLFRSKQVGRLFIAYFQSYTNTYAPVERLHTLYDEALRQDCIVGISIATRPDCISPEIIHLLTTLQKQYPDKFIWIELGLQTIHEQTAILIRRGYPLPVFEQAVIDLQNANIPIIVHVILGLPGEDKGMMLETCSYLNRLSVFGIKLQLLHVLKNTDLALLYEEEKCPTLELHSYLDLVISALEILSPDMVIHRLTGDGPKELLIAPLWSLNKRNVLNSLHKELKNRNTWQGRRYHDTGTINTL